MANAPKAIATVTFQRAFMCGAATKGFAHRVTVCRPKGPDALGAFWNVARLCGPEAFASFAREKLTDNVALAFVVDDGAGGDKPALPIAISDEIWAAIREANGPQAIARVLEAFAGLL